MKRAGVAIVLLTFLAILHDPSAAAAASYRGRCQNVPVLSPAPLPVDALPFSAIGPERFDALAADPLPDLIFQSFESGGRFNELEGGVILVAVNRHQRPAKLLVTTDRTDLLIRQFVTYAPGGQPTAAGENLRVSAGGYLDLEDPSASPPAGDADIHWERSGVASMLRPLNGARLAVLSPTIAIPVIARFMISRDHSFDLQRQVSQRDLENLFAPGEQLNTTWKQGGLFFFLHRLERCEYSLGDFPPEQPTPGFETLPGPPDDCLHLFRQINTAYNYRRLDGLDLYFWNALIGGLDFMGFGFRERAEPPSPGPGAAWIRLKECLDKGAAKCGLALAHEAGHFLGLRHSCRTNGNPMTRCGFPDVPRCSSPADFRCPAPSADDSLMRDDGCGKRLMPEEIAEVRRRASKYRHR